VKSVFSRLNPLVYSGDREREREENIICMQTNG